MRKGIIQYLTDNNITWDNALMRLIALAAIFMMSLGIREGVRRYGNRRKHEIQATDELLMDDDLLIAATPNMTDFKRNCISDNQRREIVRQYLKRLQPVK